MTARKNTLFPLRGVLAGVALYAVSLVATPAFSQMVCGDHKKIRDRLESGYQERPAAMGLAGNGGIIEIFTSDKGTFTIVLTRPNGLSCLMAVGESFEWVKSAKQARGIFPPMYPDERNWCPTPF